jgi:uncharacterized protein with NAD-binding domain and iron-sulfur cluster
VTPGALAPLLPAPLRDDACLQRLGEFDTSPIVSAHLWFDRPVLATDFAGLIGTTTQWIFNRSKLTARSEVPMNGHGQCLSTVISAGRGVVQWETDHIVQAVRADLARVIPESRAARLLRSVVVREKQATISPTLDAERWRPRVETALGHVFVAGDWTRTGLPPVIEGAVASGQHAAACVVRRWRAH